MKKELLNLHNISIGINESLIENITLGIFQGDRIGIIGPNGSGKTTLLRSLAGELEFIEGSFHIKGKAILVPQLKTSETENISGGEQSKKFLADALNKQPEILLLDEPTNHLDITAKKDLVKTLKEFKGVIICVSHDVWFLDQITNRLLIVENNKLRSFTGSYEKYQQELELQKDARLRKREVVLKEQWKLEQDIKKQHQRKSRSEKSAHQAKFDRSESRMAIANKKNKIEKVSAKNKKRFDEKREEINNSLETLIENNRKKVSGNIIAAENKGTIVRVTNADLLVAGKILTQGISFSIESGERMVLLGNNGSGKSSLVKALLNQKDFILSPEVVMNKRMRVEYLDQHYGLIDREKSVLDNVLNFSGVDRERAHQHLSHFLFDDPILLNKKAQMLSGGMLARLAFTMLTISPIDLLILDEPTNNLDQETIIEIIEILNDYQGALMVISHDIRFLEQIKITKAGIIRKVFKMHEISQETPLEEVINKVL
jgi:ATPase subunit of ABC transporter with duplicated ATPase domains